MAYVTRASWDFRTTSGAVARASKVGSYTLTGVGNLTNDAAAQWTADGVNLDTSTSDRLLLTLPAELKIGFSWVIGGFRILGATVPGDNAFMFGVATDTTLNHLGTHAFSRAGNNGLYAQFRLDSNPQDLGSLGAMTADTDFTAWSFKTALGIANPAVRAKLIGGTLSSGYNWNAGLEYGATAELCFGNRTAQNARIRMKWFAMGDGDITEAELDAIAANPSLVLPASANAPTTLRRAALRPARPLGF